MSWMLGCGFWDDRAEDLPNPADARAAFPIVASGGRELNLRILARLGVTLLGRFETANGERVAFSDTVAEHAAYSDEVAARFRQRADEFIAREGIDAPEAEPDLDLEPLPDATPTELDLAEADITSVIWSTGFTGDLSWVHLPVADDEGRPRHDGCASPVPGLWYAGFPWLTRRRSGILNGFPIDAVDVVAAVTRHLG
jgi:putative flavoprotein involved in K+ transport